MLVGLQVAKNFLRNPRPAARIVMFHHLANAHCQLNSERNIQSKEKLYVEILYI